jgi:hypothetical protein
MSDTFVHTTKKTREIDADTFSRPATKNVEGKKRVLGSKETVWKRHKSRQEEFVTLK